MVHNYIEELKEDSACIGHGVFMKISLFTDTLHTDKKGVVTVIQTMERELTREGHEVPIFTPLYPR